MKNSLIILISGFMLLNCSDSKRSTTERTTEKQWYEGGTLHRAKIREWKNSSEENKLATCGDFMATVDNSVRMEILLDRAVALRACIDEATRGIDNVNNDNVTDIASVCIITLGYR